MNIQQITRKKLYDLYYTNSFKNVFVISIINISSKAFLLLWYERINFSQEGVAGGTEKGQKAGTLNSRATCMKSMKHGNKTFYS